MRSRTLLVLAAAAPLVAGPMSLADREALVRHMEQTRDAFLKSVAGLSEEQLHFRAAPDRWTVLECAEHITLAEDNMFEELKEYFLPLAPDASKKSPMTDEQVRRYGTDRTYMRMQAQPTFKPTGHWTTIAEITAEFGRRRARNLDYVRTTQEDLRGRVSDRMQMDGYQYLLILSAHTQRHTLQIEEVKASPGFPK